jgi:hypothetical protein
MKKGALMRSNRVLFLAFMIALGSVQYGCWDNTNGNANTDKTNADNSGVENPRAGLTAKTVVVWWDITRSLYEAEKDKGLEWAVTIISSLPPETNYYLLPIHSETQRPAPLDQGSIPAVKSPEAAVLFRAALKKRILENVNKLKISIQGDAANSKGKTGYVPRDKRTCILNTLNYSATLINNQPQRANSEIIYISDMIEDCFHQSLRGGKGGFIQLTQADVEGQIKNAEGLSIEQNFKDVRVTVVIPTATDGPALAQRPDMEGLKRFWLAVLGKRGLSPENLQWSVGVLPPRLRRSV